MLTAEAFADAGVLVPRIVLVLCSHVLPLLVAAFRSRDRSSQHAVRDPSAMPGSGSDGPTDRFKHSIGVFILVIIRRTRPRCFVECAEEGTHLIWSCIEIKIYLVQM